MRQLAFIFQCKRTWESLEKTSKPRVRRCDECNRTVHLAIGVSDVARHAAARRCVAWVREEVVDPNSRVERTTTIGEIGAEDGFPIVGWVVDEAGETVLLDERTPVGDDAEILRTPNGFELQAPGAPRRDLVDGDRFEIGGRWLVFKSTL